jgi:hypothetical protein
VLQVIPILHGYIDKGLGSQPVPFKFKNTFDPERGLLFPPIKIILCSQTTWGWALCYRHHMTRHTQLPYATPAGDTFWECWYDEELLQCTSSTSIITSRYLPIPASFLRPVSLSWGTSVGIAPRALHFIMIWMSIDPVHQDGSDNLHTLLHYPDHTVAKHCASCPHEERCWNLTFVQWTTLSLLTTVSINLVNHIRIETTFQTCDIEQAKRFGSKASRRVKHGYI